MAPIQIKHSLPGRLRLHARALRRRPQACRLAVEFLQSIDGVLWVRCNPAIGGLVLAFRPAELTPERIIQALGGHWGLATPARRPAAKQPASPPAGQAPACPACQSASAELEQADTATPRRRFLSIGAVLAVTALRSRLLGAAVAQGLFSPLGLIAAAFALPLAAKGLRELLKGRPGLDSLLGGACLAAALSGQAMAALEILFIDSGAEWLRAWVTQRSRRAIAEILEITSHHTFMIVDGVEVEVAVEAVQPGDVVVVHGGEKIPVDGVVVEGHALLDESSINGRAELADRGVGDQVFAGTMARQGVVKIRAQRVGDQTYLARILALVESSLQNRAPVEQVADRLGRATMRLGLAATALTLLLTGSFWRAFSVLLVMACPCATVLAASSALSMAINNAARRRVLVKGGRYLEELSQTRVICFDKTGTLTDTQPIMREIFSYCELSDDQIVELAHAAELHQHHPIAGAIQREAARRGLRRREHAVCQYHLGRGVEAKVAGQDILVGNHKLMEQCGVDVTPAGQDAARVTDRGRTVLYLARDGHLVGLLAISNRTRPEAPAMLAGLRRLGFERIAMITGDELCTARGLADELGMDVCCYSVMPEEKAELVRAERQRGGKVVMVGDGINDALALAEADVGLAMGAGGSELAIEAADIAMVDDNLASVVFVCALGRQTMRVIGQNFWIATGSNIGGLILGALGLLSPVAAGMLHMAHTAGVLANSARLLRFAPPALATPEQPEPVAAPNAAPAADNELAA